MKAPELITEMGARLGITLAMSDHGTCRVFFDEDTVDFEEMDDALYSMASIGSAARREDAYARLLAANYLVSETGGACIGLNLNQNEFCLHMVIYGDMTYESFEARLTMFIKALRFWKDWLAQPAVSAAPQEDSCLSFAQGLIKI